MSEIGRNDPCPCGSGRKYKKCCLGKTEGPAEAYSHSERSGAQAALAHFASRSEFAGERRTAELAFWGDRLDGLSTEQAKELLRLESIRAAFDDWFVLDYHTPSRDRTIVELFLDRHGARLRSGELRYLERLRMSHLRPYEVAEVRPDEGLMLTDLWTRSRMYVQERTGTRQLVRWDIIAARVVLGPIGVPVIELTPYLYPATAVDDVLKRLKRAHRGLCHRLAPGDLTGFFKRAGALYHQLWLDHVALRPTPTFVTAEGDDVVFAKALFDLRDRAAVETALAGDPRLHRQDDGSYAWHEDTGDFQRGLGRFVVEPDRVVFEATSAPRAERGRALLEALAGPAVRYRATRLESVAEALRRLPPQREAPEVPEVPAEVEARLAGEFFERHYRTWPDTPLPALGNRTPREAAALKTVRPKLIALLKWMEASDERRRHEGRPAYDFGWMWAELDLERPG